MTRVYVAAPYEYHPVVRGVHDKLRRAGLTVTSGVWVDEANGPDPLHLDHDELTRRREANYLAIDSSDAMILLTVNGKGGEMYVELARALFGPGPVDTVYVVGQRRVLSIASLLSPLDAPIRYDGYPAVHATPTVEEAIADMLRT